MASHEAGTAHADGVAEGYPAAVRVHVLPPMQAVAGGTTFKPIWPVGEPWR